jgi:hypothetical protein
LSKTIWSVVIGRISSDEDVIAESFEVVMVVQVVSSEFHSKVGSNHTQIKYRNFSEVD